MNHQGATNIQLPNLPGVRKGPLEVPPKIYSKSRPRGQDHNNQNKQQEDRSQAELTAERIEEIVKTNSAYPIPATS